MAVERASGPGPRAKSWALADGLLLTIAFYALLGWVYIAVISIVQPHTLGTRLTHFSNEPHEDTFGEICFALSFLAASTRHLLRRLAPP